MESKRITIRLTGIELDLAQAYALKYEQTLSEAVKWAFMHEVQSERQKDMAERYDSEQEQEEEYA